MEMENENLNLTKMNIWFFWVIANAVGLGMGWAMGEWIGLQVAESFGWRFGQIVGVMIFEAMVWVTRWVVVSRIHVYDVLKPIEALVWIMAEMIVFFGLSVSNAETTYRADSLIGIVSAPILVYFTGIIGWLILWLTKVQMQKPPRPVNTGKSLLLSFARAVGSLLIFAAFILTWTFGIVTGNTVAKSLGWIIARAVSGGLIGGLLGSITGMALLGLIDKPTIRTR